MSTKILTPQEALIALAEGKKLARAGWFEGAAIFIGEKGFIEATGCNGFLSYEPDNFNGFSIFEEPKPKKKYWLWDIKGKGNTYLSNSYMDDEGRCDDNLIGIKKEYLVKKHEHLFIEV